MGQEVGSKRGASPMRRGASSWKNKKPKPIGEEDELTRLFFKDLDQVSYINLFLQPRAQASSRYLSRIWA